MRRRIAASLLATLVCTLAVSAASGQTQDAQQEPQIPAAKQTTLGLYLTASQALETWQAEPEKVKVLDVRTLEEFIFVGHAEMAWNVPLAVQTDEWDAEKRHFAMKPDPTFASRVKELFTPEDTLLVMCRSGGRSAMAVNLLAEAGFKNVYNIIDGMEGDKVDEEGNVFHGKRMKNGWKNSGLPWTYQLDPDRMRLPDRQ
ncbi:MAG: rhodanese-like domain-containing protein [Gemmatimonadota bacterium]